MKRMAESGMTSATSGASMCSIVAPAALRRATALSKAALGASRTSSGAMVSRMARRRPFAEAPLRSAACPPSSAASMRAASSTVRQSGPIVSNFSQSGTTPVRGMRVAVVLRPTRSFHAAGIRTDPPVSEPIPQGARAKATEAAAPEEEPPATAA